MANDGKNYSVYITGLLESAMYKTVEATYRNGQFFPSEPLHVTASDRILLTVIPGGKQVTTPDVHSLRGIFKGRLSSVNDFIAGKATEKELEI